MSSTPTEIPPVRRSTVMLGPSFEQPFTMSDDDLRDLILAIADYNLGEMMLRRVDTTVVTATRLEVRIRSLCFDSSQPN
jgi:hypothetical protein